MLSWRLITRIQPRHWTSIVQRTQLFQPPRLRIGHTNRIFNTTSKCWCPKVTEQSTNPLQFYAKEGGACVFWTGVGLWITFFPATQALSYFGGAQYCIDVVSQYEYGSRFVETARSAAGGSVAWMNEYVASGYITQQGIETFVLGFIVYFCLKPVRYPLWALLTRQCMRWKQKRGIISKPLMDKHKVDSKRRMVMRGRKLRNKTKNLKKRAGEAINEQRVKSKRRILLRSAKLRKRVGEFQRRSGRQSKRTAAGKKVENGNSTKKSNSKEPPFGR